MKRISILAIVISLFFPLQGLAGSDGQEYISALPQVPKDRVRLGEGIPYCYAGYGTQQFVFQPGGNSVHSDKVSNPYLPGFDPTQSTFLRFGCRTDLLFVDFSTADDSLRFSDDISHDGSTWNTIRFQYRVVAAGHSFSLLPHRLYLDLGLGYAILDYKLGRYGSSYSSNTITETNSDGSIMFRAGFTFIINHYVLLSWQHEKSVGSESVIDYTGQLGLNFMSRF